MTANPERGETQLDIGGKVYILASTFNALVALQQLMERDGKRPTLSSIIERADAGDLEAYRGLFWAMLLRHHSEMTPEQAGDLITDAGGVGAVEAAVIRAQIESAPTPEDVAALANPQKAAKATGRRGLTIGARLT